MVSRDRPLYVYDNWSTYDELSDNVPLTEELAMRELGEIKRLKARGVRIDAYLMDAFWYERSGGYLEWKKDRWPSGPHRWIRACHENGLLPGLWFPANTAFEIDLPVAWQDSLSRGGWGLCCYEGGFMGGFMDVLRHWYEAGVRVFKFDFADFGAAPPEEELRKLPATIRVLNVRAYKRALGEFRRSCPDAILCAYNGFEEAEYMTWTDRPTRKVVNPRWMRVFDSIYCGDPRPADLPLPDLWRTLDIYADHMVYQLLQTGFTFRQIDNCAFMIGKTGTCYRRGSAGWKTSLLLSLARGGRIHMALGNLENLSDEDADWYGKVQRLIERSGTPAWLGGSPGSGDAYGYRFGRLEIWVNPGLLPAEVPSSPMFHLAYKDGHVDLTGKSMLLGAGAVALLSKDAPVEIGCGEGFCGRLEPISANWRQEERSARVEFTSSDGRPAHVVFRQFDSKGLGVRTTGGAPPKGTNLPDLLRIDAEASGRPIAVRRPDDRAIWSGLSWGYGILEGIRAGDVVKVACSTSDERVTRLAPALYIEVD